MRKPDIRFASSSLLALVIALQGARALDLTPVPSFRDLDGVKVPVVEFIDAGTRINYKPPTDWHPSGGGDTVTIYPPGSADSWMKLILADKAPNAAAGAPVSAEELQALARRFIPPGAKNIAFVKQVSNSFTVEGVASSEFLFTFSFYGRQEEASISLVDRSKTKWLVLLVLSTPRDFDSIRQQAISSMFSWRRIQAIESGPSWGSEKTAAQLEAKEKMVVPSHQIAAEEKRQSEEQATQARQAELLARSDADKKRAEELRAKREEDYKKYVALQGGATFFQTSPFAGPTKTAVGGPAKPADGLQAD